MQFQLNLPDFGLDEKGVKKLKSYLFLLNEQLRFITSNLDKDNMTEEIKTDLDTVAENRENIVRMGKNISRFIQDADKLDFLVEGENTSEIALSENFITLISQAININSKVSFVNLATRGSTVINGANIITGSVTADKIQTDDLYALHADIGGWKIADDGLYSENGRAKISLYSSVSQSDKWIQATNTHGQTVFSISKDGSGYISGDLLGNGSITCGKLMADGNNRLDLKNDGRGVVVGRDLLLTNENYTRGLYLTPTGNLYLNMGHGTYGVSFGISEQNGNFSLDVYSQTGVLVGRTTLETE